MSDKKSFFFFSYYLIIAFFLPITSVFSETAIMPIDQKNYFPKVLKTIKKAEHSIYVVMPQIQKTKDEGPVSWLLGALADARSKNRVVQVYLDYSSGKDILPGGHLYDLYNFFKETKIDVFFDYPEVHLNNRVIIIDEKIVIGGSAVWSDTMDKNRETCFYIESKELASLLLSQIKETPTVAVGSPDRDEKFAHIPVSFLKNGMLKEMEKKKDETAIDAYLTLLREFDGNKVNWSYNKMADGMGLSKRMKPQQKKIKINHALKKLIKTYKLIKIKKRKSQKADIQIIQNPGESVIPLPKTYWTYRWHKTLTFHGKVFLLINMQQISFRKSQFEWKSSWKGLNETYGIGYWTMENGFIELCRNNLMKFVNIETNSKKPKESIITFHYNGMFDKKDFYNKLQAFTAVHGEETTKKSKNFAALIYGKYDMTTIEYISLLLKTYGEDTVKNAFDVIVRSNSLSKERRIEYLQRTFKQPR